MPAISVMEVDLDICINKDYNALGEQQNLSLKLSTRAVTQLNNRSGEVCAYAHAKGAAVT